MSALPKIPSPPSHYWREFRHTYLPFMVFLGVLFFTIDLWHSHVAPPSIVGEVQMVRSSVTTTVPGEILELNVDLLQKVDKGDIIATVALMEDEVINASVRAAQANLLTMEERFRQNNLRIRENYEQLKQGFLTRKVERASENVKLQFAITEFQRVEKLYKDKTVSETEYDLARGNKEAAKATVDALDALIAEMEVSLSILNPPDIGTNSRASDPILQALEAEKKLIEIQTKPLVIRAPMAGVVSAVWKHKGEKVVRGDSIVTLSTLESERIIGYVRQPLNIRPKVGDTVEVRSRSFNRPAGWSKIIKVGTQLELIPAQDLLPVAVQNNTVEYGLPILIAPLPKNMKLMPGEIVDISMMSLKQSTF